MSTSADPESVPVRTLRRVALVAGLVSLAAALVFPFAPVTRPVVTYQWPVDAGPAQAAAIPLLPYQPVRATATVGCDAVRGAAAPGAVLVSTTVLDPDPRAEPLAGLRITAAVGGATVTSGGELVAAVGVGDLPPGPCTVRVDSEVEGTTATVADRVLGRAEGDVRPAVAGAFTAVPTAPGLSLSVVADTRFQTTITPLKAALGVLAVLALAVAVGALARLDALAGHRLRRRRGSRRPRAPGLPVLADLGVVASLAVWTLIGPITVDDGYIAGIVRSRGESGQVGTVFRWLNSPETPFGWFYEILHLVAALDPAPFWLRLPSSVLGVAAWLMLSRGLLPRLRLPRRRWSPWLAAVVFLAWWMPWNLGLRPEPWVVVGALGVFMLVERSVATRAVLPAVAALALAGATVAVTPTGVIAVVPLLVAAVPLTRTVRARVSGPDAVGAAPLAAVAAAGGAATLLLVFYDQSWASVLDSVGIRTLVGGDRPWTDEYVRWSTLLTPGAVDGNLGKRLPVLLTLLGLVAAAVTIPDARVARGPARRLVMVTAVSLGALALTPTKWTHHFGAFAALGTAVVVTALVTATTSASTGEPARVLRRAAAGCLGVGVTAGLVLAGRNNWHWISDVRIAGNEAPASVGGVRLADAAAVLGVLLALGFGVLAVRQTVVPRAVVGPRLRAVAGGLAPALAVVLVVGVVATEGLTFAQASVAGRDSYTLAADGLRSLGGRSCGLADDLRVETDPRAGLLRPVPAPAGSAPASSDGFAPVPADGAPPQATAVPLQLAGTTLPGWRAQGQRGASPDDPATIRTPWFGLAPGDDPVVVAVSGPLDGRTALAAEFSVPDPRYPTGPRRTVTVPLDESTLSLYSRSRALLAPGTRDVRIDVTKAEGADAMRLVAVDGGTVGSPVLSFSVPRRPVTTPWNDVVPPGTPAAVDWPVAYLFPCSPISSLRDGAAPVPDWRIAPDVRSENESGYISYTASQGGPWATTRSLVRQVGLPVYLPGLPFLDLVSLYRWVPVTSPTVPPRVERTTVTTPGWATPGPLSVGRG